MKIPEDQKLFYSSIEILHTHWLFISPHKDFQRHLLHNANVLKAQTSVIHIQNTLRIWMKVFSFESFRPLREKNTYGAAYKLGGSE